MKYSLMSLMIDPCLRVEKPNFIHMHVLDSIGYEGPVPSVDEMFKIFEEKGVPMKNGTMTFEDMVVFAKENGFDGIDLMSFHLGIPAAEAKALFEKHGVLLSSVNVIVPFASAACEEELQGMIGMATQQFEDAVAAGTKHVMVVPAVYNLPENVTMEQSVQNCIKGLREMVKLGEKYNVTVSTETLESAEVSYCTCGEMKRIFDNVEGIHYTHDTGNPLVGCEDPITMYEMFKDKVSYVHFKEFGYVDKPDAKICRNRKAVDMVPFGEGLIDFKAHITALKRDGYDGCINLEGYMEGEDRLAAVIEGLKYFKELEKSC